LPIATVELTDKFTPNKVKETRECYGTSELEHPGTLMVATERGKYYMGGKVTGLNFPVRDFPCKTPAEVRAELPDDKDVVAFQCRNPVHRAHYELFTRALDDPLVGKDGIVLVHPTCGPTQADDIPGVVRYKTYEVLKEETANDRVFWEYLPYSMHMAGPREAIQHMMIRKNFGCTHFIIGRDMAGSKSSITGEDYYGAYDAQDIAKAKTDDWSSALKAVEAQLELEKQVHEALLELHNTASSNNDPQLTDFIEGEFLKGQVEDQKEIGDLITKLRNLKEGLGVHILDKELQ